MSDNDVLDYLRVQFGRVHVKLDLVIAEVGDLKVRIRSLKIAAAGLHDDWANQSARLDLTTLKGASPAVQGRVSPSLQPRVAGDRKGLR